MRYWGRNPNGAAVGAAAASGVVHLRRQVGVGERAGHHDLQVAVGAGRRQHQTAEMQIVVGVMELVVGA